MRPIFRITCAAAAICAAAGASAQNKISATKPEKPLLSSPGPDQLAELLKGQPMSLDEAVGIALLINRSLALANAELFISQGNTALAYTALNPTLGSALDIIRINDSVSNKQITDIDPKNFDNPIGEEVVSQNIQQLLASITAAIQIDIGGTLRVATEQAKFQQLAYKLDVDRTRNQIVSDVKGAFYDVLRAQALRDVAAEDLKNSQDRLKEAQSRLEARVVTEFDVLRAQTDVDASQQNLIVATNTVSTDLAVLNLTIGIKVNTPLTVTASGAVEQPAAQTMPSAQSQGNLGQEFDADLKEALGDRPEIKEAGAVIEAAKKGITLARRSELPSLNLSWSYLYAPNAGGTTPLIHTWAATAMFSVPIFDGGVANARRKEAQGSLAAAQVSQREAVDQVTVEVEQAYLAVNEADQRVYVADQSLIQVKAAFALAQVRYNAGVSSHAGISPLLELSDAQSALTLAESNQVNSLYDYNSAKSRLNRALGRYVTSN